MVAGETFTISVSCILQEGSAKVNLSASMTTAFRGRTIMFTFFTSRLVVDVGNVSGTVQLTVQSSVPTVLSTPGDARPTSVSLGNGLERVNAGDNVIDSLDKFSFEVRCCLNTHMCIQFNVCL